MAQQAALTLNAAPAVDPALALACRIYVGSLHYDLTANDCAALFASFGEITKTEMSMDSVTQRSKGFCFIEFKTPEQAAAAMAMNGFEIAGRKVPMSCVKCYYMWYFYHCPFVDKGWPSSWWSWWSW